MVIIYYSLTLENDANICSVSVTTQSSICSLCYCLILLDCMSDTGIKFYTFRIRKKNDILSRITGYYTCYEIEGKVIYIFVFNLVGINHSWWRSF